MGGHFRGLVKLRDMQTEGVITCKSHLLDTEVTPMITLWSTETLTGPEWHEIRVLTYTVTPIRTISLASPYVLLVSVAINLAFLAASVLLLVMLVCFGSLGFVLTIGAPAAMFWKPSDDEADDLRLFPGDAL